MSVGTRVKLVDLADRIVVSPCQFGLKLSTNGKGSLVFGELGVYISPLIEYALLIR